MLDKSRHKIAEIPEDKMEKMRRSRDQNIENPALEGQCGEARALSEP